MMAKDLDALRWFLARRHGASASQLAEHIGSTRRTARRLLNVWEAEGLAARSATVQHRWEPTMKLVAQ